MAYYGGQTVPGLSQVFTQDGIRQELSILAVSGQPGREAKTAGPSHQSLKKALGIHPALIPMGQNVVQAALDDQAEEVQALGPLALGGEPLPAGGQGPGQIVQVLSLQGHPVNKTHQRVILGLEGFLEHLHLWPGGDGIGDLLHGIDNDPN